MKLLLFFLLLCPCISVNAADATLSRSFLLRADMNTVKTWLQQNENALAGAAHYNIVKREANILRLTRDTPKGSFMFDMQEDIVEGENITEYVARVFPNEDISSGYTRVILTQMKRGTRVDIFISSTVLRPGITSLDVRVGLAVSARGVERLLTAKF